MSSHTSLLRACLLLCLLQRASILCAAATFDNGTSCILKNNTGTVQTFDPDSGDEIAQGTASDGGGNGVDLPAVLWNVFAFLLGIPLLTAGVRMGRFTSGVGLGLGLSVSIWASVINTASAGDIADPVILAITVVLFLVGFIVGVITIEYRVGSATLGAAGGISIMMRIILMREDLLVPVYLVDWILCAVFGGLGLLVVAYNERWGVILGSSAAGSFLICLGIDLLINKQEGMSRGLRYMFDRNGSHLADIFGSGYIPLLSTQILMAVTIALVPIFAYAQHKLFPRPFHEPKRRPSSILGDDASVRSRTFIGRLRGRRHTPPPLTDVEKNNESSQALVAGSEEDATLHAPESVNGYKDEPLTVPALKYTRH